MNLRHFSLFPATVFIVLLALGACGSTAATSGGQGTGGDALNGDGAISGDDSATGSDASAGDDTTVAADTTAGTDVATTPDTSTDTGPSIDNMPCPSGQTYSFGSGNDMAPGNTCIQCHSQGEGPNYVLAGTVFRNLITQTDCYASGKAGSLVPPATYTVQITDANGKVFKTTTSSLSGNFHFSSKALTGYAPPYKATILDAAGNSRSMMKAQTNGDCNACHTPDGLQGAPGRIVAPTVP